METNNKEQQPKGKVDKSALEVAKKRKQQQIKQQSIIKKDESNNSK